MNLMCSRRWEPCKFFNKKSSSTYIQKACTSVLWNWWVWQAGYNPWAIMEHVSWSKCSMLCSSMSNGVTQKSLSPRLEHNESDRSRTNIKIIVQKSSWLDYFDVVRQLIQVRCIWSLWTSIRKNKSIKFILQNWLLILSEKFNSTCWKARNSSQLQVSPNALIAFWLSPLTRLK